MPYCIDCSTEFYLLKPNTACNKCVEAEEKSETEKTVIKAKGHCRACSLVYANLEDPLCNSCCITFKELEEADGEVPRAILKIPGVTTQLEEYNKSRPRTQNANLQKAVVASRFAKPGPMLTQGKAILAEMKAAQQNSDGVKITSCLWLSKKAKGGSDVLVKVPQVTFSAKFNEKKMIYEALGTIVKDAKEFYQKSFPLHHRITRQMVSFYAHESATKALRLSDHVTNDGTVGEFFREFVDQGYITKAAQSKKEIEIRLVCDEARLAPGIVDVDTNDNLGPATQQSTVRSKHTSLSQGTSAKRKLSSAVTPGPRDSGTRNVRRSAWPAPKETSQYTWGLKMMQCSFVRTTAELDGPCVIFTTSSDTETIEIAQDWEQGWLRYCKEETYEGSGFIGAGSAKRVIYARFGEKEYALGQGFADKFSKEENMMILKAEFENMVQGEEFRKSFEEFGIEEAVVIPRFRFNLEDAILGTLLSQDNTDNLPVGLPYPNFIAMRLLPCSTIDAPIEKFTGNDNAGNPPTKSPGDEMTMALHAFTHYVIVISRGNLVLCDLQGMSDKSGVMTLIDPQSHSSEPEATKRLYWDGGPRAIDRHLVHHLKSCPKNVICTGLQLRTLEVESDDENVPLSPPKSKSHKRVGASKRMPLFLTDDSDNLFAASHSLTVHSGRSSSHSNGPLRTGWPL